MKYKFDVEKIIDGSIPWMDGYRYNAQVKAKTENDNGYYYCGIGRFCKTGEEVAEYIEKFLNEHMMEEN